MKCCQFSLTKITINAMIQMDKNIQCGSHTNCMCVFAHKFYACVSTQILHMVCQHKFCVYVYKVYRAPFWGIRQYPVPAGPAVFFFLSQAPWEFITSMGVVQYCNFLCTFWPSVVIIPCMNLSSSDSLKCSLFLKKNETSMSALSHPLPCWASLSIFIFYVHHAEIVQITVWPIFFSNYFSSMHLSD